MISLPSNADIEAFRRQFSLPIDRGIARAVKLLSDSGIETYESCEGGSSHSFPEPTIRFFGDKQEGYRATCVALQFGLPVLSLRRFWVVIDGELTGPNWEMTFRIDAGLGSAGSPVKATQRAT